MEFKNMSELLNEIGRHYPNFIGNQKPPMWVTFENSTDEETSESCCCEGGGEHEFTHSGEHEFTISELLEMLWDKMSDEGFLSLSKDLDGDIIHVEIEEETV